MNSRQTYVEGKGEVYCSMRNSRSFKCPRHPNGFKFPRKKKCKGCPYARYMGGAKMNYCLACRPIVKEDYDNPGIHFGTCQECGRTNRVIQQGYYDNVPQKEVGK